MFTSVPTRQTPRQHRRSDRRRRAVAVVATLAVLMSLVVGAAPALARTLVVDDDLLDCPVTATFTTIQGAVDAAGPGDTVQICPGNYEENVVVTTEDLTIEGIGDGEVRVAAGEGQWNVAAPFTIRSSGVRLTDLIMEEGAHYQPLGVRVVPTAGPIDGVSIDHVTFTTRVGVNLEATSHPLFNVVITDTTFQSHVTGVRFFGILDRITVTRSSFHGQQGIYTYSPSITHVSNLAVRDSLFDSPNEGISLNHAADLEVVGNTFVSSPYYAILIRDLHDGVRVSGNYFDQNTASIVVGRAHASADLSCNWWGDSQGPTFYEQGMEGGQNYLQGPIDPDWTTPWLTTPSPGAACTGGLPIPTDKNECKKGGWQELVDDLGTPFANQGDCVSFVATGGKNKADARKGG